MMPIYTVVTGTVPDFGGLSPVKNKKTHFVTNLCSQNITYLIKLSVEIGMSPVLKENSGKCP